MPINITYAPHIEDKSGKRLFPRKDMSVICYVCRKRTNAVHRVQVTCGGYKCGEINKKYANQKIDAIKIGKASRWPQ